MDCGILLSILGQIYGRDYIMRAHQSERTKRDASELLPKREAERLHKTRATTVTLPHSLSNISSLQVHIPNDDSPSHPRGSHAPERARVVPLLGLILHLAEELPGLQERRHRADVLACDRAGARGP